MTIKIDTVTASLISVLASGTGFKVGDGAIPSPQPGVEEPYLIVYTIPGGSTHGSMGNDMDMGTFGYQITVVGHTVEQCRKLQQKFHGALAIAWGSIAGCLGPSRLSLGGIVRQDDRTFVANDTLYMEVTE